MEKEEIQLSLKDQFLISPLGQWVDQHRNLVINVGIFFLAVLVWGLVHLARSNDAKARTQVWEAYAAWSAHPEDQKLYQQMNRALDQDPATKRALSAEIAQLLLISNQAGEAAIVAKESIAELSKIAPTHAEYAAISILIAQKRYQEALEKLVTLKEKALPGTVVYGRILLQIAFLQQQLNNPAGETVAWRDWEQYELSQNNKTPSEMALKGLSDQSVSFQSYIEQRKKKL